MSKYKSRKTRIGTSLDELGILLGLPRLESEPIEDYRKRLTLQAEQRPNQSENSFISTISRNVGLFEQDIFEIDLVLDANGDPIAPAPRIEITSCFLRVWSNYPDEAPELEIDIYNRGEGYFLKGVEDKLNSLSFISVKVIAEQPDQEEDSYKYKKSWNLKICDTDKIVHRGTLLRTKMNRFYDGHRRPIKYIHNVLFSSPEIFENQVSSYDSLASSGDYYIDSTNGIIFSESIGRGNISFEYRDFPFVLSYQPVKVLPFDDSDIDHIKKDYLVSDESGLEERLVLNSYGAKVTNAVLKAHSLQWGE